MRLFVAVDLDEGSRRAAAQLAERLAGEIASAIRPAPRIGWMTDDRMHLTLRFIGETEESAALEIQQALEPAYAVPVFDLELSGVGTFPAGGSPRVIWIGVTRGGDKLARLQHLVDDRLSGAGLAKEDRPFSAHLTLGRIRDRASVRLRATLSAARFEPRRSRVTHVTLYQSRLSPKGSTYVPLVKSPLAVSG